MKYSMGTIKIVWEYPHLCIRRNALRLIHRWGRAIRHTVLHLLDYKARLQGLDCFRWSHDYYPLLASLKCSWMRSV